MKIKHLLAFIIFGFIFNIIGTLFKIQHWPYASEILTIGTLIKVIFGILLIYKILTTDKFKDFLNL
ncbi:gliding motility protein GldL [Lacinutrix sp. Bg11-31]|nr:gliding motility protein GldL [Lacinutrix sp. Bg11-31]